MILQGDGERLGCICAKHRYRFGSVKASPETLVCVAFDLSSPKRVIKNPDTHSGIWIFWCERWDSNPHGVTTRTSNVLVYHSNTLASRPNIITLYQRFVNIYFLYMYVVFWVFV